MLDLLGKLLEYTGLARLGQKLVNVKDFGIKGGLHIAKAKRVNGEEGMVGVKYVDDTGKYEAVCDPEAHLGAISEIEAIYTEEAISTIPEPSPEPEPEPEAVIKPEPKPKPVPVKKTSPKVVKK